MEAAKTGTASECIVSSNPAMVEATESAGMRSSRHVRVIEPMSAAKPSATATIEARSVPMKAISIDDGRAMRDEGVVVVHHSPAAVPIESPTVPTPAEAAKQSHPKAESEGNSWTGEE